MYMMEKPALKLTRGTAVCQDVGVLRFFKIAETFIFSPFRTPVAKVQNIKLLFGKSSGCRQI